jgi:aminoglycoside phosphotransferase family enzyme/predicted kinase
MSAKARQRRQEPTPLATPAGDLAPAMVRETHTAVIVLVGDRAYKTKKVVNLGFVDFRTRLARREACHREVVLNRRMAPDVYLGVADVLDPSGRLCDHVVVMRRMPDALRLTTLIQSGQDVRAPPRQLARVLAAFHAVARRGPEIAECAGPQALRARWKSNVDGLRVLRPATVPEPMVAELEHLALRWVDGRGPLLAARTAAGLARDGHGDLLADDVFCLPDGPRALDCLEFDDRLRWMDVLDDVACLAMDLERLGAVAAAQSLFEDYEEFSGAPQPDSLRHHYVAYRAVMRAKVAAIRAASAVGPLAQAAADEAGALCRLGLDHLRQARVRLLLVGGSPASGKTTLAGAIADAVGATLLSSDRIRKELHGLSPKQHYPARFAEGIYTADSTERTYRELAGRTQQLLGLGETVIVDASFTKNANRRPFRAVAASASADLLEVRCTAPDGLVKQRLSARLSTPDRVSEADITVGGDSRRPRSRGPKQHQSTRTGARQHSLRTWCCNCPPPGLPDVSSIDAFASTTPKGSSLSDQCGPCLAGLMPDPARNVRP